MAIQMQQFDEDAAASGDPHVTTLNGVQYTL